MFGPYTEIQSYVTRPQRVISSIHSSAEPTKTTNQHDAHDDWATCRWLAMLTNHLTSKEYEFPLFLVNFNYLASVNHAEVSE